MSAFKRNCLVKCHCKIKQGYENAERKVNTSLIVRWNPRFLRLRGKKFWTIFDGLQV